MQHGYSIVGRNVVAYLPVPPVLDNDNQEILQFHLTVL